MSTTTLSTNNSADGTTPERTLSSNSLVAGGKLSNFVELFRQSYSGEKPRCVIRAPGRVNLIGDHIDYHGFAVLPMAIENCIWLGCSFSPPQTLDQTSNDRASTTATLELVNSDPLAYPSWSGAQDFTTAAELDKSHQWQNYVLCGFHGVLATELLHVQPDDVFEHAKKLTQDAQLLASGKKTLEGLSSCRLLVASDLPAASGLSSSSALVCASALAASLLLRQSASKSKEGGCCGSLESVRIAANCSKYEHLVGTRGGGMDQAVIMTAQEGFAKYVEFSPKFRCENVRLPKDTVWLVSHCGVSYPKAATSGFNTRVLETKLGAALIAKSKLQSRSSTIDLDSTITLARVKDEFFTGQSLQEIVQDIRCNVFMNRNSFTVDEICNKLELTREQLIERFKTSNRFLLDEMKDELQLLSRCEHVFEEADRVNRFKSICDTTVDIAQLGQIMTHSHYSLRDKFECSHPALDKLVSVALDAGALGSRLTGAGWGGCIVSLVEASKRDTVAERLREVSKFTFETEPRSGCEIFWIV